MLREKIKQIWKGLKYKRDYRNSPKGILPNKYKIPNVDTKEVTFAECLEAALLVEDDEFVDKLKELNCKFEITTNYPCKSKEKSVLKVSREIFRSFANALIDGTDYSIEIEIEE